MFRWEPIPEAVAYEVLVGDENGTILAQTKDPISETFWQAPRPLPRNKPLTWEVYAKAADGSEWAVSKSHKIFLLPAEQAKEMERQRRDYNLRRPLLWVYLAAKAGLQEEVEQTLYTVLQANDTSDSDREKAHQWLRSLPGKIRTPEPDPSETTEADTRP